MAHGCIDIFQFKPKDAIELEDLIKDCQAYLQNRLAYYAPEDQYSIQAMSCADDVDFIYVVPADEFFCAKLLFPAPGTKRPTHPFAEHDGKLHIVKDHSNVVALRNHVSPDLIRLTSETVNDVSFVLNQSLFGRLNPLSNYPGEVKDELELLDNTFRQFIIYKYLQNSKAGNFLPLFELNEKYQREINNPNQITLRDRFIEQGDKDTKIWKKAFFAATALGLGLSLMNYFC